MPLRFCLVGAGRMGGIHAQKLSRMRGVALTRIVDASPSQAEAMGRKHGVPWSGHHRDAVADHVDGVVIASTTETHFSVAHDFLEKGVHVFVEKPITATPDEARALIALARKNGLILQVGHLERFSPPFRKAVRTIGNPFYIEARRISAFTGRSTDIDVIHDLMIHDIDLVLSLKTSAISRVAARGASVFTSKVDVANARIEFEDGCVATLSASRASGTKERVFRVFEKDRFYSLDLAAGQMFSLERTPEGKKRTTVYKAARPDPVADELRAFVRAVRKEKKEIVDGEAGLRALLVADRISAEIETRRPGGGKSDIE